MFDDNAKDNPETYPNGTCTIRVLKNPDKPAEKPLIHWINICNSARNKAGKKYTCLGVFQCEQCLYREAPKIPRGKRSGEVILPSKNTTCPQCSSKDDPNAPKLVHKSCDCYWHILDDGSDRYTIKHFGDHDHRAPYPRRAHFSSQKIIEEQLRVAPELGRGECPMPY